MAKSVQMPESFQELQFPTRGVDLTQELLTQLPGTTPVGQNVRAYDSLAFRGRGGSRSGLSKYIPAFVNGSGPSKIQNLDSIAIIDTDAVATGGGFQPVKGARKSFWSKRSSGIHGVQKKSQGFSAGSGPFQLAFTSPVTSGHLIYVATIFFGETVDAQGTPGISDSQGNIYSQINGYNSSGGVPTNLSCWYTFAASTGSLTVNSQPSSAGDTSWSSVMAILEYSGVAHSAPAVNSDSDGGSGTPSFSTYDTGLISVTAANSRVIAVFTSSDGAPPFPLSPLGGLTMQLQQANTDTAWLAVYDLTASSSINCMATYTGSISTNFWAGYGAAFKPA